MHQQADAANTTFKLIVDVINEMTQNSLGQYTVDIQPGKTLYQAMVQLEINEPDKFSFKATYNKQYGHFIKEINGVVGNDEDKLFWGLYISKKFSDKGVDSYCPQDGDHVLWKYMKYFSADVSVIDTIHGNKTLGHYHLDYVNLCTSLCQMMIRLESQSEHKFNFVTSVYARHGHSIEAIQGIWINCDKKLYWAIYNHDEPLDKDKILSKSSKSLKHEHLITESNTISRSMKIKIENVVQ